MDNTNVQAKANTWVPVLGHADFEGKAAFLEKEV